MTNEVANDRQGCLFSHHAEEFFCDTISVKIPSQLGVEALATHLASFRGLEFGSDFSLLLLGVNTVW